MRKRKSATVIRYFITSLTLLILSGCAASGPGIMPGEGDSSLNLQTRNIENYQLLIEEVLSNREITLNFYRELNQKLVDGLPLNGEDMETLNLGLKTHLDLRERLYQVALAHEDWVDDPPEGLDEDRRLQGVMLSLSAALVLYDNYLLAVSAYEENGKLRRYIDSPHPEYQIDKKQLTEIAGQYHSPRNRYRVQRAIRYFERSWRRQNCSFKSEETNDYLYTLISQSPSYNTTLKSSPLHSFNRYAALFADITTDALISARDEGVNLLSLLFGNSVGMVRTRKGYLHNRPEVEGNLQKSLRAGDILLEKTPFCLTDKLIPGYWGHVAIWIGNEQELIDLGIWDHPALSSHKKAIRNGGYIVEALRSGVMINSLSHFLDVDDLAILRKKKSTDQERAATIIRALQQVGKPYDFNFNVETNNKIVCSELIYICYTDINWPTSNTLGRYTISPSHVAGKVGPEKPFEVVDLYLHGKEIENNMLEEFSKTVALTGNNQSP